MEAYIKRMLDEHSELVKRIQKLETYVYSDKSDKDDKIEYVNKCIQLAAMRKYEEALSARLYNRGIEYENGVYKERIGTIKFDEQPEHGSDFDIDGKK